MFFLQMRNNLDMEIVVDDNSKRFSFLFVFIIDLFRPSLLLDSSALTSPLFHFLVFNTATHNFFLCVLLAHRFV